MRPLRRGSPRGAAPSAAPPPRRRARATAGATHATAAVRRSRAGSSPRGTSCAARRDAEPWPTLLRMALLDWALVGRPLRLLRGLVERRLIVVGGLHLRVDLGDEPALAPVVHVALERS